MAEQLYDRRVALVVIETLYSWRRRVGSGYFRYLRQKLERHNQVG